MDGLDEAYVRRAFIRSRHGAEPSAAVRAGAMEAGYVVDADALWIEVAPADAEAFTELCPLCLLACVELRRRGEVWLGRHEACGTILHAWRRPS